VKWIREHTHIVDHPRLLEAGANARDLWHWGMLYAGNHETDGRLPMSAVLASPWGAGGKKNITVAQKLVEVGLWDRVDSGYQICRWVEMGNPTKADLDEKRREERDGRKTRRKRSSYSPPPPLSPDLQAEGVSEPDPAECPPRTPQGVPYSDSYSSSGSGSSDARATPRPSEVRELADPLKPPPDWWESVCETITFQTGEKLPAGEAWLRYAGHRGEKRGAPERGHATYWLTTVMVREARETREKARRQDDRDAKFDKEREKVRAGPPNPFEPRVISEAEQRELVEKFPMPIRRRPRGAA